MRRTTVKLIILCVLLGYVLCPFRLLAQSPFEVKARTDTDRIRIGEQLKLELTADLDLNSMPGASLKVVFPNLPDSFAHWEVVDRTGLDTLGQTNGEKHFKQTLTLTSFDSGHWEIPPLKFEVYSTRTDGSYDSMFTQPIGIDVGTVTVDTTKAFKPIKSVRTVDWAWLDYWPYMAAGAGLVIVLFALWWFLLRKRKKKEPAPEPVSLEPVYDRTIRLLKELDTEKVWQQGNVKEYYSRLTDILRTYFEEQFGIAALEQTTAELLQNIKPVTILNQQRDKLRSLLSLADLAKFAKLQPSPEEHVDSMHKAMEIVEWTKPAARPAEGQGLPAPANGSGNHTKQ
ncbi:hypothetical protein F0L74_01365 [Chitinophaga agrisoli]|uniref:Oxygen tolerance protein BatD n=1 Tax=Chitinophaga agrisoli TaxID=2607653 RepID=A0A5B2VYX7_9BACT|nr:hypothetical protein [Chitinophaga agrisoli]KAA2244651.1 hypothetical protein F0L74_01365 [Chitinophaga agrisoli]